MTGSALFIQHDWDALPGYVGARFGQRGFDNTVLTIASDATETNRSVDFGDPGEYDVIVPLGSVWSVYDTKTIGNWIGAELEFLAQAHERGIPILGICFGGQALAAALGAAVEPAPEPEVGWRTIDSDRPDVLAEGPWMQWHYDRFSVPDGGLELARTAVGPQAFTAGRSLGLQFHPEVSAEIVGLWLNDAPESELSKPHVDVDTIRSDSQRLAPQAKARTHRLVDWFLDDVAALTSTVSGGAAQ